MGPALLLAALAWKHPASVEETRIARTHLWVWVGVALAVVAARPGYFALQFLVGAGVPLLILAALGLGRFAPRLTVLAAIALAGTSVVATRVVLAEDPNWFVPRERMATALALRASCGPEDLVLAPPDISLYAIGLSACHAVVAHPAQPDYVERLDETRRFYETLSPPARAALLDARGVTRVVLPGDYGPRPTRWLGAQTPFVFAARVGSTDPITVYARAGAQAPSTGARAER